MLSVAARSGNGDLVHWLIDKCGVLPIVNKVNYYCLFILRTVQLTYVQVESILIHI